MEAVRLHTVQLGHTGHPEPAGGVQAGGQLHEAVGRPAGMLNVPFDMWLFLHYRVYFFFLSTAFCEVALSGTGC